MLLGRPSDLLGTALRERLGYGLSDQGQNELSALEIRGANEVVVGE